MAMTKAEIVSKLSEITGQTKRESVRVLEALISIMESELKETKAFTIPNIAILRVAERAAKDGRNPKTGEKIKIAPKNTVRIKVAKHLKDALNA